MGGGVFYERGTPVGLRVQDSETSGWPPWRDLIPTRIELECDLASKITYTLCFYLYDPVV